MSATLTGTKPFTADDYRRMEDDGKRYEVVNGELLMAPAPNRFHQAISRNLCRILYSWLHAHPLGKAYDAPFDVYLDDYNVVQPDLVYIATENSAKLVPEGVKGGPDLVVEILSPRTALRDLRDKRDLYARFGVREFWVVSPDTRQLQIYELPKESTRPSLILEETDTAKTSLLPGLLIPLVELFAD